MPCSKITLVFLGSKAFHLTDLVLATYTTLTFHLGRPAYFDLSVRSTTQSAVISSASSQAGVAAAVGEIAKDNQYQDIVNDNGGDFIPLVCETFGVWSPYALSILGSIADRTTVRNGLPRKFARRQLLQQLSVTLWRYNAK